jgi:hypothetical protein
LYIISGGDSLIFVAVLMPLVGNRYVQRLTRRAELTKPSMDILSSLQAMRVLMVDQVSSYNYTFLAQAEYR